MDVEIRQLLMKSLPTTKIECLTQRLLMTLFLFSKIHYNKFNEISLFIWITRVENIIVNTNNKRDAEKHWEPGVLA